MRLEDLRIAEHRRVYARRAINPDKTDDAAASFHWIAVRNCVSFYLNSKRLNINPAKYHSFQRFLSLTADQARDTNVWRWYFKTGGHPPYDPFKEY